MKMALVGTNSTSLNKAKTKAPTVSKINYIHQSLCCKLDSAGFGNVNSSSKMALRTPIRRTSLTVLCGPGPLDQLREAAKCAVDKYIESGMVIGLGCGTASCMAIDYIGTKLARGYLKAITAVPMSTLSAAEAAKAGIPLSTLDASSSINVAFTDADAVLSDSLVSVIGRQGVNGRDSIVQEKAVLRASEKVVLLCSQRALVEKLEDSVPVEIQQEDWLEIAEEVDDCFLAEAEVWRRPTSGEAGPMGGDFPLVTKEGNFVLDLIFTVPMENPAQVVEILETIDGVVDYGLLLSGIYSVVVGTKDGPLEITPKEATETKEKVSS